jgi:hypothetical protein
VRQALNLSPEAIERAAGGAAHAGGPAAATPEDRLEKLAKLRAEGVVTQEEFEAQKAKILGGS